MPDPMTPEQKLTLQLANVKLNQIAGHLRNRAQDLRQQAEALERLADAVQNESKAVEGVTDA